MVARKPVHQGERVISRKAIAQGRPGVLRCPVCSCALCFVQTARETAGAARTRSSLRPLIGEDGRYQQTSGAMRREIAKLFPRRPGEGRDPYAAASRFRKVGVDTLRDNFGRWLWVPAFAGTTVGRCCASTYALPSLRAQARQSGAALCANRLTFNDSGEGIRSPSRGAFRPRFACVSPSSEDGGRREDRVAAAPGAPAPEKLREGRVTTGTGGDNRPSLRSGVTAYTRSPR
jgi:hypothetical protein